MTKASATKQLFAAIAAYPFHGAKDNPQRAAESLARIRAALEAGADWKKPNGPGERDAAFSAATIGDERPLELLLEHGVPWNHETAEGTLLHRAASFGRLPIIRRLLALGVPVDALDAKGRTPLACARAWKHGDAAVPLLTRLTKAAKAKAAKAKGTKKVDAAITADAGNLRAKDMRLAEKALLAKRAFSPRAGRALGRAVRSFFAESPVGSAEALLLELQGQGDDELLAAGLSAVRQAVLARPAKRVHPPGDAYLAHVGDLTIDGDCDARALVVTGDLTVKGRLTNFEGRMVCVGGNLKARSVFTEGPLWVFGDLTATEVFSAFDHHYVATIKGTLQTKLAVVAEDHEVRARRWQAKKRYRSRQKVLPADAARIGAERLRSAK
jgi:hypothetical protein